jgi:hypothetical protein
MANKDLNPFLAWLAAITVLLVSVAGITWLLRTQEMSAPLRLGLALIPVIAFIFVLIAHVKIVRRLDELQQRIYLEALAIAFPLVAVVVMACEYLRKSGFIAYLKPDHVLMILIACWLTGWLIAWRRYR